MVLLRRNCSHAVSLGDSEEADRILGRSAGQSTFAGPYPPVGESERALFDPTNVSTGWRPPRGKIAAGRYYEQRTLPLKPK